MILVTPTVQYFVLKNSNGNSLNSQRNVFSSLTIVAEFSVVICVFLPDKIYESRIHVVMTKFFVAPLQLRRRDKGIVVIISSSEVVKVLRFSGVFCNQL